MIAGAVGHCLAAEEANLIPVIHFETRKTVCSEDKAVFGVANVWECYFEPVSDVGVQQTYSTGRWRDSGGQFPHSVLPTLISQSADLFVRAFNRYVSLNERSRAYLNSAAVDAQISESTLSIHFRGDDMRTAKNHPMRPTTKQILRRIDKALGHHGFRDIFLVAEQDYVRDFSRRCGSSPRFLDVARYGKHDIYSDYVRPMHRYFLGLEVLTETLLLFRGGGLVSGYSGVSEMAHVFS